MAKQSSERRWGLSWIEQSTQRRKITEYKFRSEREAEAEAERIRALGKSNVKVVFMDGVFKK